MYHMKIDSFLSVIEDLFGWRLQVVTFFQLRFYLNFFLNSQLVSFHCVRDAQIEKKKVLFYSWYFIQVMFHSFSSRATKNMPHENQKQLVTAQSVVRYREKLLFSRTWSDSEIHPFHQILMHYSLFYHFCCHASEFITCHGHTREAFPNAFLMDIKPDVIFVNGTRVIQCLSGVWKRHTVL